MTHPISDELAGVAAEDRAAHKAAAFAARPVPDNLTAGSRIVAVNDISEVGGILQFTVALWIDSGVGMELIDLGDLNPIRVVNPPILVDDPAGDIVREWNDPETGLPQTRTLREDLDAVLLQIATEVTAKFEGTGGQM